MNQKSIIILANLIDTLYFILFFNLKNVILCDTDDMDPYVILTYRSQEKKSTVASGTFVNNLWLIIT